MGLLPVRFAYGLRSEDRWIGVPDRFSGFVRFKIGKIGNLGNILKINRCSGGLCASCVNMFPRVGETSPHSSVVPGTSDLRNGKSDPIFRYVLVLSYGYFGSVGCTCRTQCRPWYG